MEQKTLRDEFAMAALTGLIVKFSGSALEAEYAYKIADAMMKAREKQNKE